MIDIKPRDIIALVAFVSCAILLVLGLDGQVKALMGVIIGYYFATAENSLKKRTKTEHEE